MYSPCRVMYITFGVENFLSFAFVVHQICVKKRDMGMYLIFLSLIFYLAPQGVLIFGCTSGLIGVRALETSKQDFNLFTKLIFAASLLYVACTACAKAVVCYYYHKILSSIPCHRKVALAFIFLIVAIYPILFIFILCACKPFTAGWLAALPPEAKCYDRDAIYKATTIIGAICNFSIGILPIPTIWSLQTPSKKKVAMTLVVAVGGTVTTVIPIYRLANDKFNAQSDLPWVVCEMSILIMIETKLPIVIWILFMLYKKLDSVQSNHGKTSQPEDDLEMTKDIESQPATTG